MIEKHVRTAIYTATSWLSNIRPSSLFGWPCVVSGLLQTIWFGCDDCFYDLVVNEVQSLMTCSSIYTVLCIFVVSSTRGNKSSNVIRPNVGGLLQNIAFISPLLYFSIHKHSFWEHPANHSCWAIFLFEALHAAMKMLGLKIQSQEIQAAWPFHYQEELLPVDYHYKSWFICSPQPCLELICAQMMARTGHMSLHSG